MKTYTVYFSKPIPHEVRRDVFDKETKRWKEKVFTEEKDCFTFYDLRAAKAFIKQHRDLYKGSCITKTWANGDWENLGEIKLEGSNKHFIANTRQKKAGY